MKTLKAPRNCISRSAAGIPALLMLVALSGSALAATEIQQPCPEATSSSDVLHAFIERDAARSAEARTVDAKETLNSPPVTESRSSTDADDLASIESSESEDSPMPEFTTRVPGVPVNDLPGFRRHMYRTDI